MHLNGTAVALSAQSSYEKMVLNTAIDALLAPVRPGNLRGQQILLKPNLITARNGRLACTDGRFIAAVARWFLDMGARVTVGDSPSFGSARSVLRAIGVLPELERLAVSTVEFRHVTEMMLPCGQRAALATAALECDLLVNLPKVKAHSQMRLTLAVKNLFGCLVGFHKPWWHMVHGGADGRFADLLVDLLKVLPPGCTVVDGIVAMHETGPIHGEPHPLGILAAGVNPVAVDTALLAVLGVDPRLVPLWCAADRAAIAGTRMEDLVFPLSQPGSLVVQPAFAVPETLTPVRFNPLRFGKNAIKRWMLRLVQQ